MFTLGVLIIYRIGSFIPAIGINTTLLAELMAKASAFRGFLAFLILFLVDRLQYCTIFALGIQPYITASIMMQMLSMTVPSLEAMMKEGDYGRAYD